MYKISKSDVLEKYKDKLKIPFDNPCSNTIIVNVYGPKKGHFTLTLAQNRSDITTKKYSLQDLLVGRIDKRLIMHEISVPEDDYRKSPLKEGDIFFSANLAVDYSLKPFYEGQEPVKNPSTDIIITSGKKPIYRKTRLTFEEAEHVGLTIKRDKPEKTRVIL